MKLEYDSMAVYAKNFAGWKTYFTGRYLSFEIFVCSW